MFGNSNHNHNSEVVFEERALEIIGQVQAALASSSADPGYVLSVTTRHTFATIVSSRVRRADGTLEYRLRTSLLGFESEEKAVVYPDGRLLAC